MYRFKCTLEGFAGIPNIAIGADSQKNTIMNIERASEYISGKRRISLNADITMKQSGWIICDATDMYGNSSDKLFLSTSGKLIKHKYDNWLLQNYAI